VRPIDIIREKLDPDLLKYHSTNLCKIDSDEHVHNLKGVGVCAIVRMFDNNEGGSEADNPKPAYFPVLILNRTSGYLEKNISKKYNVLLLSTVADRTASLSVGFLVSKTAIGDVREYFRMVLSQNTNDNKIKKAAIKFIRSLQETNHVTQ